MNDPPARPGVGQPAATVTPARASAKTRRLLLPQVRRRRIGWLDLEQVALGRVHKPLTTLAEHVTLEEIQFVTQLLELLMLLIDRLALLCRDFYLLTQQFLTGSQVVGNRNRSGTHP